MVKGTLGVYKIENLNNGKVYIGFSSNIYKRANKHIKMLTENNHNNKNLQADWNKYGKDEFKFSIENTIDIDDKITKNEMLHIGLYFEGLYMDKYKNKYNVLPKHYTISNNESVDISDRVYKTFELFNSKGYFIKSPVENITVIRTRRTNIIKEVSIEKIKTDTTAISYVLKKCEIDIPLSDVVLSLKLNYIIDDNLDVIKYKDVILKHEYKTKLSTTYGLRIDNTKFNEFSEIIKYICNI